MNTGAAGPDIMHRLAMSLAPVLLTALIGQGVYVLVWGIKLDGKVSFIEGQVVELRTTVNKLSEGAAHRSQANVNRFGSLEEQMNETQSRIDTLIALMRVRERSDNDYQRKPERREERPDYRLQSDDSK